MNWSWTEQELGIGTQGQNQPGNEENEARIWLNDSKSITNENCKTQSIHKL